MKLPHRRETALALSLRGQPPFAGMRRRGVTIRVRKETAAVIVEVTDDGRGGGIVRRGLNGMRGGSAAWVAR